MRTTNKHNFLSGDWPAPIDPATGEAERPIRARIHQGFLDRLGDTKMTPQGQFQKTRSLPIYLGDKEITISQTMRNHPAETPTNVFQLTIPNEDGTPIRFHFSAEQPMPGSSNLLHIDRQETDQLGDWELLEVILLGATREREES